jgi:ABC-type dipeptide/oligopeptide/nickel transport system ATPase component
MDDDLKPTNRPDYLRQWWDLFVTICTGLTAAGAAIGFENPTIKLIAAVTTAISLAACLLFWRRKIKLKYSQKKREESLLNWNQRPASTAFRGLFPFQKGDYLPGENRRREAQRIATQVANSDFSFGVLSGEVGCGKSSILQSGVQALLENSGLKAIYIRSPRQLLSNAIGEPSTDLDLLIRAIEKECEATKNTVLIIDQAEELFLDYTDITLRQKIGSFFRTLYNEKEIRVLCAVRHDYILDINDLSPGIPNPLSSKNLFRMRNFSEAEAASIIQECSKSDNLAIDDKLARLIASDLSHESKVRPPELQIVCTALSIESTLDYYREAGGAKGILLNYVKDVLTFTSNPEQACLILRALCDYSASPPVRNRPLSRDEIIKATGLPSTEANLEQVNRILQQLDSARLTVSTKNKNHYDLHSLVHDYLVGPVGAATDGLSTLQEQANQLLKLYLADFEVDPKVRIPFRRLKFIEKNANLAQISSSRGRKLLKSSRIAAIGRAILFFAAITSGSLILYMVSNTSVTWQATEVGRHPFTATTSPETVTITPSQDTKYLFTVQVPFREAQADRSMKASRGIGGGF